MKHLFVLCYFLLLSFTCFAQPAQGYSVASNPAQPAASALNALDAAAAPRCTENADFEVNICSPGEDANVNSPVNVVAAAKSTHHITAMQIYVDFELVFHEPDATTIDTNLPMAKGTHSIDVKAWDNTGRHFSSSRTIHVVSAAPVPVTRFLYEAAGSNNVLGFSVNSTTGELTPLSQGPVSAGQGFPQWLATDREGRFLFVSAPSGSAEGGVKIGEDMLATFRIDKNTGDLTPVPGSPIALNTAAGPIAVMPDGKFLYMQLDGQIVVYKVDQDTGGLALVPGSPFGPVGFGTDGIVVSPSGKFLYLPQSDIEGFALDPNTGIPTQLPGSQFTIRNSFFAFDMGIDPQGRFLFTGGLLDAASEIDVEQVEGNGALKQVSGSPFNSNGPVGQVGIDASGKFLYLSGFGANQGIIAFSVNASSGELTPVPGSPFVSGTNIGGFATDQAGKFLYVGTAGMPGGFAIDRSSGALTPLPSNPSSLFGFDNAVITVAF